MNISEVMLLVSGLEISDATKSYIGELLQDMVQAKSEKKGWSPYYEVQGAINALEREGLIDEVQHTDLSVAIGEMWNPVMRSLIIARIEQEAASSVPMDAVLATLEEACAVLDDVRGSINPELGYVDELESDVSSALSSVDSLIARCQRACGAVVPAGSKS